MKEHDSHPGFVATYGGAWGEKNVKLSQVQEEVKKDHLIYSAIDSVSAVSSARAKPRNSSSVKWTQRQTARFFK